jgi:hypothetical protein
MAEVKMNRPRYRATTGETSVPKIAMVSFPWWLILEGRTLRIMYMKTPSSMEGRRISHLRLL